MRVMNQEFVYLTKEAFVFFKGDNKNPDMLKEKLMEHFVVSTWTWRQPLAFMDRPAQIFILVCFAFVTSSDQPLSFKCVFKP